ncbi:PTS sugar transporter subunit IIA [Mesorhizobium sp. ANAO-SY3R2]|uniref:PTS sugar transporter subunit IIA n=1 Tax=Mesorhizobium sp. ANAO-SY3R2 TaxID=3166644 RepID=UPI00366AEB41
MAQALIDHIAPQAVALGVKAQKSEEVIRLLAGKLESLGYVRSTYADAVVRREATMPTGLPLGYALNVAIPHTDPEHVIKPGVALAVLSEPVDFANMEDPEEAVPVGFVFLLAINDKDKQIDLLQEIMETIQSSATLEGLANASSVDDVKSLLA